MEKELTEMEHWSKHYDIAFNRGLALGSIVGFGTAAVMLLLFVGLTYL